MTRKKKAENRLGDEARLAALAATGLMDTPPEAAFDRVTGLVRRLLGADIALMTLVERERQFFKSVQGLSGPAADAHKTPLPLSPCQHVVAQGAPFVVADARAHPLLEDTMASELGIVAYLGVPLRHEGQVIGALGAAQREPREWTRPDEETLLELSELLSTELGLRRTLLERERAEAALQAREAHYLLMAESASDGVVTIDEDSRILYANARVADIFGHPREALQGQSLTLLMPDYLRHVHEAGLKRYLETGRRHLDWEAVRVPGLHANGHEIATEVSFGEHQEDGQHRFTGIIRDVSERERAAEALRESQRRLSAVLSNTTAAIFLMDERQSCIYMNAAAEALTGYSLAETQGRALHDVLHHTRPDGTPYPLSDCPIDRAFPEGHQVQGEEVFVHKDGSFYPVAFTASPIREGGQAVGTVVEVRDVTEEKATHAALGESEKEFRAMFEISSVGKAQADVKSRRFLRVNDAFCRITGYSEAELLGMSIDQLNHPEDAGRDADVYERLNRAEARSYQTEKRYVRKDGSTVWVNVTGNVIHDASGRPVRTVAVIQDVTEEKRAEEALREARLRLESTLAAGEIGTWTWDSVNDAVVADKNLARLFGVSEADAAGGSIAAYLSAVHPDDRERVAKLIGEVLADGESYETSYRLVQPDGDLRWVIARGTVMRDAAGRALGLPGVVIDVTEAKRAEERLRESEARFRAVQQATPDGFMVFESVRDEAGAIQDFRWVYTNPAGEKVVGRSHEELQGKLLLTELPGNREEGLFDAYVKVVETGEVWQREFHYPHEGMDAWFRSTAAKAGDGFAVAFADVSAQKRAEETLSRQAEMLRLAHDAIFVWRVDGPIESWNQGAAALYGYSETDALGKVSHELLRTIHPESLEALLQTLLARGAWEGEVRHRTKDGRELIVSSRHQLVVGEDGHKLVLEINRDITESRRAEAALRESEARARLAIQLTQLGTWRYDLGSDLVHLGERMRDIWGEPETAHTLPLSRVMERVHPEDRARVAQAVAAALEPSGTGHYGLEYRITWDDGSVRWVSANGQAEFAGEGAARRAASFVGTALDITERREAQAALLERERLATLNAEVSQALIQTGSVPEVLQACTEAVVQHLGAAFARIWLLDEGEEMLELQASSGLYTHLNGEHARVPLGRFKIGRIAQERRPHLTNAVLGDPQVSEQDWAEREGMVAFAGYPLIVGERLIGVIAMFAKRPLSAETLAALSSVANAVALGVENKQSEAALHLARAEAEEAQHHLRLLVDNLPELAWWARPDGFIDFYNRRWYEYTGAAEEDMEGWGWQSVHHPDMLAEVVANWQYAISTGQPLEMEFPIRGADGVFRWFLTRARPLKDAEGKILRWIGVNTDINARREAEAEAEEARARLEEANHSLEQRVQERTAELGAINQELTAFNYSVSHDLRAPLRGIDGFAQALREEYMGQLDDTALHYLGRIQAAAQRMGELIDDLLDLSRLSRSDMQRAHVDLSELAEGVLTALRAAQPGREVRVSLEPGLRVQGDRRMLKIALENLLGNAWKFTQQQPDASVAFGRTAQGVYVVRDNGAGFDMAYAGKLFAPFQRLHGPQEFEGTGIGLATVQRVVHRHGGAIWAESAPGQGATFYFTLPDEFGTPPEADAG